MESVSNPLIYLASASPRRSALLDQIGVPHRVQPVDVDETARGGEDPEQYVRRLALPEIERMSEQYVAWFDSLSMKDVGRVGGVGSLGLPALRTGEPSSG